MSITVSNLTLLLAALTTALMAGLFYNWTSAVTVGLAGLPDREYVAAMQSINKAIQNPVFFLAFFGSAVLLPLCSFLHYQSPVPTRFWLLFGATVLYLIGVMGVTVFGNVPLNDALDKFNLSNADSMEIAKQRLDFEGRWNSLNNVRTWSSLASLTMILVACIYHED